jgi:hypothetical protein
MESVMNFLADNYIWFFVAAALLSFALIGFIIESRKKQKNEFKGESIEEKSTNVEVPVSNSVVTETQVSGTPTETSVPVVEPVVPVSAPVENTITAQEEPTMEINDIPLANENKPSSIEFYNGPIEMNTPKPEPAPIENIRDPFEMGTTSSSEVTATIGNPISYEQVSNAQSVNNSQINETEKVEDTNNNSTF